MLLGTEKTVHHFPNNECCRENRCFIKSILECCQSVPQIKKAFIKYNRGFSISSLNWSQSVTTAVSLYFKKTEDYEKMIALSRIQKELKASISLYQLSKEQEADIIWNVDYFFDKIVNAMKKELKPIKNGDVSSSYK